MKKLQSVRGTLDLFPENKSKHNFITEKAKSICDNFGFKEIETPIFEFAEVFSRPLGQTSDVVSKETYNFEDRSGELLTLRPEGTAGVIRAVISNGNYNSIPLKYFYRGPMFRYERPQKGRLRQFNQIGVELLGISEPYADAEVISCSVEFLKSLNVLDKCVLNINTLGDLESRISYREILTKFLMDNQDSLSLISQKRLKLNPLRILDSKETEDQEIVKNAPVFKNFLNKSSLKHFDSLLGYLDNINIKFEINSKLVRGLDYYCHTVFEFITNDLGSQGTVLGGGRYDGLSETLLGPKLPGVGFSAGVERLSLLLNKNFTKKNRIAIIPFEQIDFENAFKLLNDLRQNKFESEIFQFGNIGKELRKANKKGFTFVILLGGDEFKNDKLIFKDLSKSSQIEITKNELFSLLTDLIK